MSGYQTKHKLVDCGCGGKGILWVRPSDYGDGSGSLNAFCGQYCGIQTSTYVFRDGAELNKKAMKTRRVWNRAMFRLEG